ncbi:MAG: LacI family transcriptional regulator [Spirochaetales bacterium]|nr:LacI family transcriptional regulator [Spirochaetales bacterium]
MSDENRGITIKDVAERAGVSTATVSRVVNGDTRVSEKTRELVLACLEETGYRVNPIARSLRSRRSHTIGIVAPEFQNEFFMNVAEGLEGVLRERGMTTFILNSRENPDEERARIDLLIEKQADGAIIIPAGSRGEHYEKLRSHGIPFVLVDRMIDGIAEDCVLTNNFKGAFSAVEACINDGAEEVALIGGPSELTSAAERHEGYEAAMIKHGLPLQTKLMQYGDMHIQSGYDAVKDIVDHHPEVKYFFIVNLFMRIGAETYFAEKGKNREDVKIASFDYSPVSSLFRHSFVTVRQPLELIGSTAADLLMNRIEKYDLAFPQVRRLAAEIIFH